MSQKMITRKINLTRLYITKEIQFILLNSDDYQKKLILKNQNYQQQLIEYTIANINSCRYMKIEKLTEIPKKATDIFPPCSIEERLAIRQLLYIGMIKIVQNLLERTENSLIIKG